MNGEMLPSRSRALAEPTSINFQQMSPMVYTHINICTNRCYQFYLVLLNYFFFAAISFSNKIFFWRIAFGGSISNGFSVITCLVTSSLISEELLLASEKDLEQFFSLLTAHLLCQFVFKELKINLCCTYFF